MVTNLALEGWRGPREVRHRRASRRLFALAPEPRQIARRTAAVVENL